MEKDVWDVERKGFAATTSAKGFKNWRKGASQYFIEKFVEEVERIKIVHPVIFDRDAVRWTRPDSELPWQTAALNDMNRSKISPGKVTESDA